MYLAICLLGGMHGLMFLPVLLSMFGPGEDAPPFWACLFTPNEPVADTLLDPSMGYDGQPVTDTKPAHHQADGGAYVAPNPVPASSAAPLLNPVAANGGPRYTALPSDQQL